jgi:hypothetical protein
MHLAAQTAPKAEAEQDSAAAVAAAAFGNGSLQGVLGPHLESVCMGVQAEVGAASVCELAVKETDTFALWV